MPDGNSYIITADSGQVGLGVHTARQKLFHGSFLFDGLLSTLGALLSLALGPSARPRDMKRGNLMPMLDKDVFSVCALLASMTCELLKDGDGGHTLRQLAAEGAVDCACWSVMLHVAGHASATWSPRPTSRPCTAPSAASRLRVSLASICAD
jgi:hypothetical protein